jgi:hypothetical protein
MSDESSMASPIPRTRSSILHDVALTIRRYQESAESDEDLAAAARLLCEDTRRRALPIERAIIDLKTALLAEAPDLTPGDSLAAARARLIQMTIEEYYRS